MVGGEQWRDLMGLAREVAWSLQDDGVVVVEQRGEPVTSRTVRGPVRLAVGPQLIR